MVFASPGDRPAAEQTGKGDKRGVKDRNQKYKSGDGNQGENV